MYRKYLLAGIVLLLFIMTGLAIVTTTKEIPEQPAIWIAPDTANIPDNAYGQLIIYGRALVTQTAYYLGPSGIVKQSSNGLNCQNCHLEAGTKIFGNNFSAVAATYPKYRDRSGIIESIEKKINDCFERSMNGRALDSNSREMNALIAYMKWLGQNVAPGVRPYGAGLQKLPFLDRAADTVKGAKIFSLKCAGCHGEGGKGQLLSTNNTYLYPPLWGEHSYNNGAGIYRIGKFAAFVRDNMPLGASYQQPTLSVEEAWDVAAFVNSQPRPQMDLSHDWPRLETKPPDHPYGPFADNFSAFQHKYGPFKEMVNKKILY